MCFASCLLWAKNARMVNYYSLADIHKLVRPCLFSHLSEAVVTAQVLISTYSNHIVRRVGFATKLLR